MAADLPGPVVRRCPKAGWGVGRGDCRGSGRKRWTAWWEKTSRIEFAPGSGERPAIGAAGQSASKDLTPRPNEGPLEPQRPICVRRAAPCFPISVALRGPDSASVLKFFSLSLAPAAHPIARTPGRFELPVRRPFCYG